MKVTLPFLILVVIEVTSANSLASSDVNSKDITLTTNDQVSRLSAEPSETIEVKSIDQPSGKWIPSDAARDATVKSEIAPEATGKVNTVLPLKTKSFAYWTRQHHDIGKAVPVPGSSLAFNLVKSNNYHADAGNHHGHHGLHYTNGYINHGQKVHHFLDDPSHGSSLSHQVNSPHSLVHSQFYHQNAHHPFHPLTYNYNRGQHHQYFHPDDRRVSHAVNDVNLGHVLKYQLKQPIYHHQYSHSHLHPHPGHNTLLHQTHHQVTHGTSGYEVHAPNYIVWNYRN